MKNEEETMLVLENLKSKQVKAEYQDSLRSIPEVLISSTNLLITSKQEKYIVSLHYNNKSPAAKANKFGVSASLAEPFWKFLSKCCFIW